MKKLKLTILAFCVALTSAACGGGGGNSGGGNTPPPPPPPPAALITITTASVLPGAVQGKGYSTTLAAANGQGALHWSIAPIDPNSLFVTGLSIDANTGVISGTASFQGTAGFTATVTDSASSPHSNTHNFFITSFPPLTSAADQTTTIFEFQSFPQLRSGIQGGIPPIKYSVTSGTMPPGLRFDNTGGSVGGAFQAGTYQFTLTAQDSFSPPETATQNFNVTVRAPSLSLVQQTLPSRIPLNVAFRGRVVATGGNPPYMFAMANNSSLPPNLLLNASSGVISGTPTVAGPSSFSISATDSSSPAQTVTAFYQTTVSPALQRNDTPTTATAINAGMGITASISPYVDPPNGVPAPDNDYYKIVSFGNSVVHVETTAKRLGQGSPLDTVIEIVDANNIRLNTCRQPGDTSTTFAGACLNDDISATPHIQDSALDIKITADPNTGQAFYVHVFDWSGGARPDMTYILSVSGVVGQLQISPSSLPIGKVAASYFGQLLSTGGTGPISWVVTNQSLLPPGVNLLGSGQFSGTPTAPGTYPFTVQATDSAAPPQTATQNFSITINP